MNERFPADDEQPAQRAWLPAHWRLVQDHLLHNDRLRPRPLTASARHAIRREFRLAQGAPGTNPEQGA